MKNIYLNNDNTIVLIDCSYYIFRRYYATKNWFERYQNIQIDVENIENDEVFLSAFQRHFEKDIVKISKKLKTNKQNIYMCLDCLRADIWRMDIHNTYKGHRKQCDSFNRVIFDKFKEELNSIIPMIKSDRMEADDIIATIHEHIRRKYPTKKIVVISDDNDYIQLKDEHTRIMNMSFKDLIERNNVDNVHSHMIIKYLTGDKSDNIPNVGKMRKDKAVELSNLPYDQFMKWLNNSTYKDAYYRNKELMCFSHIPEYLKKKCLEQICFVE